MSFTQTVLASRPFTALTRALNRALLVGVVPANPIGRLAIPDFPIGPARANPSAGTTRAHPPVRFAHAARSHASTVNRPRFYAHFLCWKDGAMSIRYDENTKARAVRLVREHRDDYESEWGR